MSSYLIQRLRAQANIEIVEGAQVSRLQQRNGLLETVCWSRDGMEECTDTRHLFLFIGAEPNTGWLAGTGIALDSHGFVCTGDAAAPGRRAMETSRSGIFAIGDVRAASVKRVAAAAGDGAQVVAMLHEYLAIE
jgi:thioredoxin reductase (NADPH)